MYIFLISILLQGLFLPLSLGSDTTDLTEITNNKSKLTNYLDHLKKDGANVILSTGERITANDLEKKAPIIVDTVITDYVKTLHNHFNFIKQNDGLDLGFTPDVETMYLYMMEKSCELLYRHQWQLINTCPMSLTATYVDKIQSASKFINKQIENWKKREMHHVCINYGICRPYPAFTDHLERLTLQLLNLPDHKVRSLAYLMKNLLVRNQDFWAVINEVKGEQVTLKELENLFENKTVKGSLSSLRLVLKDGYKISNEKPSLRIQATKTLLDVMDQDFHFNNINLSPEFEHFIAAIDKWDKINKPFDALLMAQLLNSVLLTLRSSENPMKSVSIETIIREKLHEPTPSRAFMSPHVRHYQILWNT